MLRQTGVFRGENNAPVRPDQPRPYAHIHSQNVQKKNTHIHTQTLDSGHDGTILERREAEDTSKRERKYGDIKVIPPGFDV